MGWLAAGGAYEVALVEGRVAAGTMSGRAAGRQVGSLPKVPKDHPEEERLRGFAARDTALGHRVSGSLATCRVRDGERVAWSEGARRTAALYAGRAFEEGSGG